MSETLSTPSASLEFDLQTRLDALECGDCTEDDLVREILQLRDSAPDFVWSTLALIDQRYRRGHLAQHLFRSIKTKIARHEVQEQDKGRSSGLHPSLRPWREETERIGAVGVPAQASIFRTRPQTSLPSGPAAAVAEQSAPDAGQGPTAMPTPPQPAVGSVLRERYLLERLLGQGGMGTVYKALDCCRADLAPEKRHIALKLLNANVTAEAEILADLRREFYCAQALSHPNIVKVYEMHQDNEGAFFTMELLEGELLSSVLERMHPDPLPRAYAWAIIRSVGAGVAHAHARNVVHGDLKPQNIMITERGEVRILDFGASSSATRKIVTVDPLERSRTAAVTPAYTCCELLDGQQTDPRDDLYALACLSYELLTGDHPFQRRCSIEARDLGMQPRRPQGISDEQWRALELGLGWQRESRSLSVRDWLAKLGLEPMTERLPPLYAPEAAPAPPWKSASASLAALIALIAVVGVWAAGHGFFKLGPTLARSAHQAKLNDSKPVAPANTAAVSASNIRPPADAATAADAKPSDPQRSEPPANEALLSTSKSKVPLSTPPPAQAQPAATVKSLPPADARPTRADKVSIAADSYNLNPEQKFAEIEVRRLGAVDRNASFVWWTEGSTAVPGSDFAEQHRTTQFLPKGRRTARLYVRIVPNRWRNQTETFFVVIGSASGGYSLGPVTRAAVRIPPG